MLDVLFVVVFAASVLATLILWWAVMYCMSQGGFQEAREWEARAVVSTCITAALTVVAFAL